MTLPEVRLNFLNQSGLGTRRSHGKVHSVGFSAASLAHRRALGLGLLSTGVICPCHVLVGLFGLLTGGSLLSPAAQDGLHAVYVPLAVLGGALVLRRRAD